MKNEKVGILSHGVLDPETPFQNKSIALFSDRKVNIPTFWKTGRR
jgi:hypothetical protein